MVVIIEEVSFWNAPSVAVASNPFGARDEINTADPSFH
jgi:hypothetical protein